MRIGILLDRLSQGAYTRMALEEARHLAKRGHDASVVVMMQEELHEYRYEDLAAGVSVRHLSPDFPSAFRKSRRIPGFSFFSTFHLTTPWVAPRVVKAGEYDVLLAHGAYTCLTARSLARRRKIPYSAFVHDPVHYIMSRAYKGSWLGRLTPLTTRAGRVLDRRGLTSAGSVVTNSRATLERTRPLLRRGVPTHVAYPACDPQPAPPPRRGEYALAATKWDVGKDARFFVRLWAREKLDLPLVIAGFFVPPEHRERTLDEVRRLGLQDVVTVRGPVPEEELRALYRGARVLLHPIREAFGMTVLEAASFGVPSLVPDGSGVLEVIPPRADALRVDEGDADAYGRALLALLTDPALEERARADAYAGSRARTWDAHAAEVEAALDAARGRRA